MEWWPVVDVFMLLLTLFALVEVLFWAGVRRREQQYKYTAQRPLIAQAQGAIREAGVLLLVAALYLYWRVG